MTGKVAVVHMDDSGDLRCVVFEDDDEVEAFMRELEFKAYVIRVMHNRVYAEDHT